jgi:hypothetical protein
VCPFDSGAPDAEGFGRHRDFPTNPIPTVSAPSEMSFDELMRLRLPPHVEGILPARHLGPGETLLYSTRPSLVGYALPGIVGGVVEAVILGFFWWWFLSISGGLVVGFGLHVILFVAAGPVAAAAGRLSRWWFAAYAETTTRILVKHGGWTRRIIDIPHGAVRSVMFEETGMGRSFDYGTLQFSSGSVAGWVLLLPFRFSTRGDHLDRRAAPARNPRVLRDSQAGSV